MSNENTSLPDQEQSDFPEQLEAAEEPSESKPTPARSGLATMALLLALLAVAASGYTWWLTQQGDDSGNAELDTAMMQLRDTEQRVVALRADLAELQQGLEGRVNSTQSRLESVVAVNTTLREQLLGLTERADVAEQALARLAEMRSGSNQTVHLNQADALMTQASERMLLSADVALAISALQLADAELAQLGDPLYSGVRQRLATEIDALKATPRVDTVALYQELRELQQISQTLQLRETAMDRVVADPDQEATALSRAQTLLARFVSVRRVDSESAGLNNPLDTVRAREQLLLGLQLAELALARRDSASWQQALQQSEQLLEARFESDDQAVQRVARALNRLQQEAVAPVLPEIGRAHRELRNLRSTQSLGSSAGSAP